MIRCMRTTVDLPDDLLARARLRAAEERTTLTGLLADGLRLMLADRPERRSPRPLPLSTAGGGMHPSIDATSNAALLDAADDHDAAA